MQSNLFMPSQSLLSSPISDNNTHSIALGEWGGGRAPYFAPDILTLDFTNSLDHF